MAGRGGALTSRVPLPLVTAVAGALLGLGVALLPDLARTVVLLAVFGAATAIDVRTRRIPNWLTAGGGAFALTSAVGEPFWTCAVGAALALALGFTLWLVWPGAFGMGDAKLMGVAGAALGAPMVPTFVLAMSIAGGVMAGVLMLRAPRGERARRTFAYGPAIAAGYALALLFG